jgi:hypothetical protein
MTATTERDRGVLSRQIRVGRHDGHAVVHWSQAPGATGLTTLGIQRALEATAGHYGALDDAARNAGAGAVRVGPHVWEIPAAGGGTAAIAELMQAVLVADDSVGVLPS